MNKHKKICVLILIVSLNLVGCNKAQITLQVESDIENIVLSESTEKKKWLLSLQVIKKLSILLKVFNKILKKRIKNPIMIHQQI
jgi:hypothetical protein